MAENPFQDPTPSNVSATQPVDTTDTTAQIHNTTLSDTQADNTISTGVLDNFTDSSDVEADNEADDRGKHSFHLKSGALAIDSVRQKAQ